MHFDCDKKISDLELIVKCNVQHRYELSEKKEEEKETIDTHFVVQKKEHCGIICVNIFHAPFDNNNVVTHKLAIYSLF